MPRIPSLAQIQASRKNGAHSPGPKSPEAKAKTRFNALQHGLTARSAVLPHESESRFRALLDQFIAEHQPATLTELTILENFATSAWRLRRFAAYETAIHTYEIEHTEPAPGADFHTHAALTWADSTRLRHTARYQAAEQRLFRHSFHDLLAFQHLRGDRDEGTQGQEAQENQPATVNAEVLRNDPEAETTTPQTQEKAVSSQHQGDSPAVEPANPETETSRQHHCGYPDQAQTGEQAQPNQPHPVSAEVLRNDPEPQITTPQMKEAA